MKSLAIPNCFLDANVLIDYVIVREPFFEEAELIFLLAEQKRIKASISMLSVGTLCYYAQRKYSVSETKNILIHLKSICHILEAKESNLEWALTSYFSDYEDGIQNNIADTFSYSTIVTRDKKDFKKSNLAILTPQEFLATL